MLDHLANGASHQSLPGFQTQFTWEPAYFKGQDLYRRLLECCFVMQRRCDSMGGIFGTLRGYLGRYLLAK